MHDRPDAKAVDEPASPDRAYARGEGAHSSPREEEGVAQDHLLPPADRVVGQEERKRRHRGPVERRGHQEALLPRLCGEAEVSQELVRPDCARGRADVEAEARAGQTGRQEA